MVAMLSAIMGGDWVNTQHGVKLSTDTLRPVTFKECLSICKRKYYMTTFLTCLPICEYDHTDQYQV